MSKIAFIGLGHMGLPMAINLLKNGHVVTGFDLQQTAMSSFAQAGGLTASTLSEATQGKEIIITMLQSGKQVAEICIGSDGFYPHCKNTLHIDCSSIDVMTARELHQQAAHYQLQTLDAPVSGGVNGARNASLTFMVGGSETAYKNALPILVQMGKKIIHTGEAGTGQAAKICNNMILGISMIAVAESFTLAQALGLEPKRLLEVVNNSSGECWVSKKYLPVANLMPDVPANNDYRPGFSAAMMLKDLLLSQQAASATGLQLELSTKATSLYHHFKESGHGDLDFSAIITAIKRKEDVHEL